ncbi:MAG: choice-of-anchor L domain-containing protein [Deltaproteobacteria bacterium]|nr:choice-of-anchor L domain-containing protein [Deltaproteobacteria bacterium]
MTVPAILAIAVPGCSALNPDFQPQDGATASSGSASTTGTDADVDEQPTAGLDTSSGGDSPLGTAGSTGEGSIATSTTDADVTGTGDCACALIEPCPDDVGGPPHTALGVDCADVPVQVSVYAAPGALGVMGQLGTTAAFLPTEGSLSLVMGTGDVSRLDDAGADCTQGEPFGRQYDFPILPAPLIAVDAGGDCLRRPQLAGFGDCSNTIEEQFTGGAFDYTDVWLTTTVPDGADAVAVDYAFLTAEYPDYIDPDWNDMFVVWLESEQWTGNIALDGQGNAIAIDSVQLDYMDDDSDLAVFEGTCMVGHGATGWNTGSGPVVAGEEITVVLALWDGGDPGLDAYALVDGLRWECGACL